MIHSCSLHTVEFRIRTHAVSEVEFEEVEWGCPPPDAAALSFSKDNVTTTEGEGEMQKQVANQKYTTMQHQRRMALSSTPSYAAFARSEERARGHTAYLTFALKRLTRKRNIRRKERIM